MLHRYTQLTRLGYVNSTSSDDPNNFEVLMPNNFLIKKFDNILQGYLIHHHMSIDRHENQYKEQ